MSQRPLISLVIPVYNAEDTLRRAADSVLRQTYANLELVLVDDGSTDESPAIVDAYAAEFPARVRVVHRENGGLMRAWRDGVREGHGDIFAFVDSDDWIEPEMIEVMAAQLIREGDRYAAGQIVCCNCWNEYQGRRLKAEAHALPAGVYEGGRLETLLKQEIMGHEERRITFSRCMKLISAELITGNLSFLDPTIRMGEDGNITVPAMLDATRVVVLKEAYYHYIFGKNSMVHCYDARVYDDYVKLRECWRSIAKAKGRPDEAQIQAEFLILFLRALKNEVRRQDGKGAAGKAIRRVRELCRRENSRELVRAFPEKLKDQANRLMAFVCRRPSVLRILLVRLIFLAYEGIRSYRGSRMS